MEKTLEERKGITLIALVISIIVLLILAGVSIAMLTGDNGILTQANNAKIEQSHATVKEGIGLAYNEYQIEVKTGEETTDFLSFLTGKTYTESNGKIIVENLTGSKQALGNGEGTSDIYKVEGQENTYIVNYYDKNGTPQEIWNIEGSNTGTEDLGEVTLDPDTGKEALILEYQVSAGDTIELPYDLEWVEFPNGMDNGPVVNDAIFNFEVDWGDGTKESGITNANIAEKAKHQYQNEGTYDIKITGTYEVISRNYQIDNENYEYANRQGIEKLAKVKQWGTTGIKNIALYGVQNLTEIVTPTESSFKDLTYVIFAASGIKSIPDKLFANCTGINSFESCFADCTNLTTIGNYVFANCTSVKSFANCFNDLKSLTTIGDYLFANCSSAENFSSCFHRCINLIGIGEHMFEGCENVTTLTFTFGGCINLKGKPPELWLTGTNSEKNDYMGNPDGFGCFNACENLDNYEKIPDYWKHSEM